jgi:hypothetical protein
VTGQWWFSPVSFTNKTVRHDITEILLKVALNTITISPNPIKKNRKLVTKFIDKSIGNWFGRGRG